MTIPDNFFAGDSLSILVPPSGYLASDGWQAHLRLAARTVGNTAVTLDSTAEGSAHRLTAAAATTAEWAADDYTWILWFTRAAESITLTSGSTKVKANPRNVAAGFDGRSDARKALDDARAAYYAFNPTRKGYKIGDREMQFSSAAEILVKVRQLESEVAREELLAGTRTPMPRRIYTRI